MDTTNKDRTFVSSALGSSHEYRGNFSDQVKIVLVAHDLFGRGGELLCRVEGQVDSPFVEVLHSAYTPKRS